MRRRTCLTCHPVPPADIALRPEYTGALDDPVLRPVRLADRDLIPAACRVRGPSTGSRAQPGPRVWSLVVTVTRSAVAGPAAAGARFKVGECASEIVGSLVEAVVRELE